MDQHELLNQIINHKMFQQLLEAEMKVDGYNRNIFTRNQLSEITQTELASNTELILKAISIQIAEEEEMFRYTK